jgi:hypothetical protein
MQNLLPNELADTSSRGILAIIAERWLQQYWNKQRLRATDRPGLMEQRSSFSEAQRVASPGFHCQLFRSLDRDAFGVTTNHATAIVGISSRRITFRKSISASNSTVMVMIDT